jgi:hypothetical protein
LLHYDLPDLAKAINAPVTVINPIDGEGNLLEPDVATQAYGPKVATWCYPKEQVKNSFIVTSIQKLLDKK